MFLDPTVHTSDGNAPGVRSGQKCTVVFGRRQIYREVSQWGRELAPPHFLLNHLELHSHAVRSGLPLIWNFPTRVLPQMKVKPRKLKVSGLQSPRVGGA